MKMYGSIFVLLTSVLLTSGAFASRLCETGVRHLPTWECSVTSDGSGGVSPHIGANGLSNVDSVQLADCVNAEIRRCGGNARIEDIGWHFFGTSPASRICSALVVCQ